MYIYCDRQSRSAKALAKKVPMKFFNNKIIYKNELIINWGCSDVVFYDHKVINHPEAVRKAANKLLFFQVMSPLGITPRFCTSLESAKELMLETERPIACRTILTGHSGNGIILSNTVDLLVPAKLYVEYIPKQSEWRVHVFNGSVIDIQRKARNREVPDEKVNWHVRTHANGFIYMRGDVDQYNEDFINQLKEYALKTINQLKLDFGAVDIILTKQGRIYVLEVNTAPGLEGTTLENYINAIRMLKGGN